MVSYIHLYCHFIVLYYLFSIADDVASIATADIDDAKTVILEPVDAEHTGYETSWGPVGYSSKYHTLRILVGERNVFYYFILFYFIYYNRHIQKVKIC